MVKLITYDSLLAEASEYILSLPETKQKELKENFREIFLNQRGNQRVTASTVFRFVLITPSGAVRRHLRKLKAATPTRAIIATRMPPRIMTIHLMNLRIPASVSLLRATVA